MRTIVVVDDEPDVVTFVQAVLEDNGYMVHTASSAKEALRIIRRDIPDLICLDVLMPEESGLSLYQRVRTDPDLKRIPVVILSGLSRSRDLGYVDFLKLEDGTVLPEPDGYIEKPVHPELLLEGIKEILA